MFLGNVYNNWNTIDPRWKRYPWIIQLCEQLKEFNRLPIGKEWKKTTMTNLAVKANSLEIHKECLIMIQIEEEQLALRMISLIHHSQGKWMKSSKLMKRELSLVISSIMMKYLNFFARKCLSRNKLKILHHNTLTNTSKIWWLNKMPNSYKNFKNGQRLTAFQLTSSTHLKITTIPMKLLIQSLLLCQTWIRPMQIKRMCKEKTW